MSIAILSVDVGANFIINGTREWSIRKAIELKNWDAVKLIKKKKSKKYVKAAESAKKKIIKHSGYAFS